MNRNISGITYNCLNLRSEVALKSKNEMAIYRNEETDKVNLFESGIKGILFRKFGTRIIIQVDWLEGYGRFNIVCNDCRHIDINFKHSDDTIGAPWITGFSYIKRGEYDYTVQLNSDFTPEGYIKLDCSEFYFDAPSPPLQPGGNDHRIEGDEDAIEKDMLD